MDDHQLQIELRVAEVDLERKLAQLRTLVTERVDETIARVRRPLRWLARYKWALAGGAAALLAAVIVVRHRMR